MKNKSDRLPITNNKVYSCVESFCGPGGMGLGLTQAGFDIHLAFDIHEPSVQTYRDNIGDHCIVADASTITAEEILERIELSPGELDLWSGGPPCQGFSKQKRGAHLGDPRNELVSNYISLVETILPRTFLFENVAIFGQKRGVKYLNEMREVLSHYNITSHFYNCADYGLAQTRKRFIAIGIRKDIDIDFHPPDPTHKQWVTVRDVLYDIPEPPEDYTALAGYPNHQRARVTPINIKRFSFVPPGGGWRDIPYELRLPCHQKVDTATGGWPDVYGRLRWDGQCPTITGGFDSFTRGRYGHPEYNRPLTPYEAALLQGFPHGYSFHGTRGDVRSQIGNAVPPPLAKAIGIQIRQLLTKFDYPRKNIVEEEVCEPM